MLQNIITLAVVSIFTAPQYLSLYFNNLSCIQLSQSISSLLQRNFTFPKILFSFFSLPFRTSPRTWAVIFDCIYQTSSVVLIVHVPFSHFLFAALFTSQCMLHGGHYYANYKKHCSGLHQPGCLLKTRLPVLSVPVYLLLRKVRTGSVDVQKITSKFSDFKQNVWKILFRIWFIQHWHDMKRVHSF